MPAVTLIGVNWGASSSPPSTCLAGVRSNYGDAPGEMWVVWRTDVGPEWFDQFNISCSWKVVPKGVGGGFGYWSSYIWSNVKASTCNPRRTPGASGYTWALKLSDVGSMKEDGSPSNTSVKGQIAPSGWGFSQRVNDAAQLQINVNGIYKSGTTDQFGKGDCGTARSSDLFLLYVPRYTLTGAELSSTGGLDVTYSVTDWPRTDDRWAVVSINQGGVELASDASVPYVTWDWVADSGLIKIPSGALVGLPDGGDETYIEINMNANFRGNNSGAFASMSGSVTLVSTDACNTPVLTVLSADADAIVVRVTDSGDKGNPFETAYVQLAGQPGGAVACEPGGTATIALPPLGEPLVIQAYGTNSTGGSSDVVEARVPAIHGGAQQGIIVAALDGSAMIEARYNVSCTWDFEPESESYKMSGRERESVFYGVGGSATCDLSFDILDDARYGSMRQSAADVEALAFAGTCVYREPGGVRRVVAVDSVSPGFDKVSRLKSVSMSLREVG